MSKSAKFWDRMAARYARSPVPDEAVYQKKLEVTRGYFQPEMELLEFGCGTGSTAIAHAPYVKHIRATDISGKMLEIAQGKADAKKIENVTFEKTTIEALSGSGESYDIVLGLSILHLVQDKEAVMAKVHKLLKPGGRFVTSTACLGDTMKFFKLIGPIGHFLGLMPLVKVFTTEELRKSMVDAGFELEYDWQPEKGAALFLVGKKA